MARYVPREAYNRDLRPEKLAQVILYFVMHANNAHLGKTKLMKLLYYADFDHFEKYGESITGARYRKLPQGPVPDDAWSMIDQLVESNRLSRDLVQRGEYNQEQYSPVEFATVDYFSDTEQEILKEVVDRWKGASMQQIAEATHKEAPWVAVGHNEIIPYYLAYYRNKYGEMDLDEEELYSEVASPDDEEIFAR